MSQEKIEELKEKLREAERELSEVRLVCKTAVENQITYADRCIEAEEKLRCAEAKIQVMREALEWYADDKNFGDYLGEDDFGNRARRALEGK